MELEAALAARDCPIIVGRPGPQRACESLFLSALANGVQVQCHVIHHHRTTGEHHGRASGAAVAFEPTTLPVVSVYLNTQPDQHGRATDAVPYLHREFKALARTWAPGSPERHSFDRDVERILSYVADKIDPAANGVALFACWGAGEFFEAIQLAAPVSDNRVYAYKQPLLYHLAHIDEQYPRYAAVLTDMNTARIFVFGLDHVIAAEEMKGKKVHRVKVGGWSQARYQRRVGNAHAEHAKEVMERLAQIVHEDKISHIILAGDSVVIALLQEQLHQEMNSTVEVMKLDIHASEHDVLAATL